MLTLTDNAKQKVIEFITMEEKTGSWALRLSAQRMGPRKFHYELNLEEKADRAEDDIVRDFGDFEVVMDPQSAANVEDTTMDFEQRGFESGFKFDNPQTRWKDPLAQKVQEVLDRDVNPAVASHGGRVELLRVEGDAAYLSFGGGCQGCGMADVTLKQGVEVAIKDAVPEIAQVLDSTDHSAGANPYFASQGDSPF